MRQEHFAARVSDRRFAKIARKVDAADPASLIALRATLFGLSPGAVQNGAVLGEAVALPDLPANAVAPLLPPLDDDDTRGAIFPTRLMIDDEIDWSAFAMWLSALLHARGNDLVRVKGVIRTPAGRLLLQTVRKVVQSPEILPEQTGPREDGTVVFIGRGFKPEDLRKSLRRFAGKTEARVSR